MSAAVPHQVQVIIVEDDAAVAAALAISLELQGYSVWTCGTAEELLRATLPQTGACLIMDERLPGLSGLEAVMRLRQRGETLPAALITSTPPSRLQAEAAARRVMILEKPLLDDRVSCWVRQALRD